MSYFQTIAHGANSSLPDEEIEPALSRFKDIQITDSLPFLLVEQFDNGSISNADSFARKCRQVHVVKIACSMTVRMQI